MGIVATEKQQHRLCRLPGIVHPFDSKAGMSLLYVAENAKQNQGFLKRILQRNTIDNSKTGKKIVHSVISGLKWFV